MKSLLNIRASKQPTLCYDTNACATSQGFIAGLPVSSNDTEKFLVTFVDAPRINYQALSTRSHKFGAVCTLALSAVPAPASPRSAG